MASTGLFVVLIILAALLLLTASLTSTFGAIDTFNSSLYSTDNNIRAAHQYLTIAAALGWSSLTVLVVILIVTFVSGSFTTVEISETLLVKDYPTREDLLEAYRGEKELASGHTSRIIILVVLIIVAIITFIVGVLAALAAIKLGEITKQDDKSIAAYTQSIIAAASGIGGIGIMIIALVTYISVKSAREEELEKVEAFERKAEAQLGVRVV